jgi:hypothetical protein
MNIEMKNLTPQQIRRSIDYVNRTQDVWIERYFKFLERCRIEASAQGVVLVHLRDAWRFYGQYRAGADPSLRWSAWSAIQKAAAALAHSVPIASKEGVR